MIDCNGWCPSNSVTSRTARAQEDMILLILLLGARHAACSTVDHVNFFYNHRSNCSLYYYSQVNPQGLKELYTTRVLHGDKSYCGSLFLGA